MMLMDDCLVDGCCDDEKGRSLGRVGEWLNM